jgi:hypothetical protein
MALTWRGHTIYTDAPSGGMFKGYCSCGWESTWRDTEDSATGAALNHAWRVTVAPRTHDPDVPGRMVQRHGETMTKREFMDALRRSA